MIAEHRTWCGRSVILGRVSVRSSGPCLRMESSFNVPSLGSWRQWGVLAMMFGRTEDLGAMGLYGAACCDKGGRRMKYERVYRKMKDKISLWCKLLNFQNVASISLICCYSLPVACPFDLFVLNHLDPIPFPYQHIAVTCI